ncbi:MAG: ATP12 family protein, partial [Caulobacteraceae bacterium]
MPSSSNDLEKPKRFYARAEVSPVEGGFAVKLDGRIPRSPYGPPLVLPTEALAVLAVEE